MLKKTLGIVLNHIKYKDSSIIVRIFTRELGLKGYLVHGVRSLGKGSKIALYQPLTLLELVVYDKENPGLQRISEAKIKQPQRNIPFDMARTSLALFATEVIHRSILEGYQNEELFDFLYDWFLYLDSSEICYPLAHIKFMLALSKHLGFGPLNNRDENKNHFDLNAGRFVDFISGGDQLDSEVSFALSAIVTTSFENLDTLKIVKGSYQPLSGSYSKEIKQLIS